MLMKTINLVSLYVEKMCGGITFYKCTNSCNKTTYFCLKTKLILKRDVRIFYSIQFFSLQSLIFTKQLFNGCFRR